MRMLGMSTALMIVVAGGVLAVPPVAQGAAPRTCHGHGATIVGTNRGDVIDGTPGRDVILGLGGDDVVRGRGGNDVICGNDGGDKLMGGAGDDRVYGGYNGLHRTGEYLYEAGDSISGGRGNDLLDLGDDLRHPNATHIGTETLSYADSRTGVHLDLAKGRATGEGHDTIVKLHLVRDQELIVLGSPDADVIKGTGGRDRINPLAGNDVVFGRRGGDILQEDGLTPFPPMPNGTDVFHGGSGHDHLGSSAGHDVLDGGDGPDSLRSSSPAATLSGGPGADFLSAGTVASVDSATVLRGGRGDDHMFLFDPGPGTVVHGGGGSDRLDFDDHRTDPLSAHLGRSVRRAGTTIPVSDIERWYLTTAASAVDIRGTDRADHLVLVLSALNVPVTSTFGPGSDVFRDRGVGSLDVSMGRGDDHLRKTGRGGITALLGGGDDRVETASGHWAIGPGAPARTYNGGAGTDTAKLDLELPNNTCTSFERGNCP